MEETLRGSKTLYKVFLILLKYIPVLVTVFYILNTALYYCGIDAPVLSNISGMSLLTWLFMYIATFVFKFCTYHRLLLYYVLANDLFNIGNWYFTLTTEDSQSLAIHSVMLGVLILVLLINHVRNIKKTSN